jgi:dipeptidase D
MKQRVTRIMAAWVTVGLIVLLAACSRNVYKQNLSVIKNLPSQGVLREFAKVSAIPRGSGNETAIADYIVNLAQQHDLRVQRDTANNVFVYIPATKGLEDEPPIVNQVHMDMVMHTDHGAKYPVRFRVVGDTLSAVHTTLGADDGIALAMLLSEFDNKEGHRAMYDLFTTGEENGFTGANALDYAWLKNIKLIFNLDSEEGGTLTIGSAGGMGMSIALKTDFVTAQGPGIIYKIVVSDLLGGHSGVDINKGRANAIKIMTQVVMDVEKFHVRLMNLSSGAGKINAIPDSAETTIFVPSGNGDQKEFLEALENSFQKVYDQYGGEKPKFTINRIPNAERDKIMVLKDQEELLQVLNTLPNGVIQMEPINKSLVGTSNNIGVLTMKDGVTTISMLFRSSSRKQIDSVRKVVEAISANGKTAILADVPVWPANPNSAAVQYSIAKYKDATGKELVLIIIHAGLECSLFAIKMPDAQIV